MQRMIELKKRQMNQLKEEINVIEQQLVSAQKEEEQQEQHQLAMECLVGDNDIIDQMKQLSDLLPSIIITDDLFHAALSTRNEIIIRMLLRYVPITSIQPEQLEFFLPLSSNVSDEKKAYSLIRILEEEGYRFGKDETSRFFQTQLCELSKRYQK